MDEMKYSVLVVDDHPLMRKGIVQLLELEDNIDVVGEASNGTDAVAMAKESEPDLILLDLNMKGLSGLDTLKALRAEEVTSRVVILTVSDARQDVVALLKAGADGYLLKDSRRDLLLAQLAEQCPQLTPIHTGAGLQCTALLPPGGEARWTNMANRQGLGLRPLRPFYLGEADREGWLLGYAGLDNGTLRQLCRDLGRVLREG